MRFALSLVAVELLAAFALANPPRATGLPQATPAPAAVAKKKKAGIPWHADYGAGVRAAERAGKPVLILYSAAAGCPACDTLSRTTLADPGVVKAAADFVCIRIDPTTPAGAAISESVGLQSWPTVTTHPAAGRPTAGDIVGVRPAADLLAAMRKAKAAPVVAAADPFRRANVGHCTCHAGGANCYCQPASNCARGLCPVH